MSEKDYDRILASALKSYKDDQLSHIPDEDEIDYEFSPEFERKGRALIQKQSANLTRTITFWAKRAAVFFVVFAIAIGAVMTTNAGKGPQLGFTYEERPDESEIVIDFPSCLYDEIQTQYIPEMSDDLTVVFRPVEDTESVAQTQWFSDGGEMISLSQFAHTRVHLFDVQYSSVSTPVVNGIRVLLLQDDLGATVCWAEEGYMFEMWLSSYFGVETIYSVVGKMMAA